MTTSRLPPSSITMRGSRRRRSNENNNMKRYERRSVTFILSRNEVHESSVCSQDIDVWYTRSEIASFRDCAMAFVRQFQRADKMMDRFQTRTHRPSYKLVMERAYEVCCDHHHRLRRRASSSASSSSASSSTSSLPHDTSSSTISSITQGPISTLPGRHDDDYEKFKTDDSSISSSCTSGDKVAGLLDDHHQRLLVDWITSTPGRLGLEKWSIDKVSIDTGRRRKDIVNAVLQTQQLESTQQQQLSTTVPEGKLFDDHHKEAYRAENSSCMLLRRKCEEISGPSALFARCLALAIAEH